MIGCSFIVTLIISTVNVCVATEVQCSDITICALCAYRILFILT